MRPVGKRHVERAALEVLELAQENSDRDPVDERHTRTRRPAHRANRDAHPRTEPCPGTNAGLWWNGTRFNQSRSAWRWISAVTCSGISG